LAPDVLGGTSWLPLRSPLSSTVAAVAQMEVKPMMALMSEFLTVSFMDSALVD
jgi:hypothetical protein